MAEDPVAIALGEAVAEMLIGRLQVGSIDLGMVEVEGPMYLPTVQDGITEFRVPLEGGLELYARRGETGNVVKRYAIRLMDGGIVLGAVYNSSPESAAGRAVIALSDAMAPQIEQRRAKARAVLGLE